MLFQSINPKALAVLCRRIITISISYDFFIEHYNNHWYKPHSEILTQLYWIIKNQDLYNISNENSNDDDDFLQSQNGHLKVQSSQRTISPPNFKSARLQIDYFNIKRNSPSNKTTVLNEQILICLLGVF